MESRSGTSQQTDNVLLLMQRYKDSLYSYVLTLTRSSQIALDCTQEVFLRAQQNLERGKPVNARWLHTVARNLAVDELRRHQHEGPDIELLEDWAAHDDSPSKRILEARRALAQMSPDEREILHLFVIDRFRSAEIADMLGASAAAVRMRISRARQHFRQLYGDAP
jgi:RNA polymerase sigma-70 factor (ECF subfamily)